MHLRLNTRHSRAGGD